MADFDAQAAKAAGYSDDEIAKITKGIAAARAAGYSDDEIQQHLSGSAPTKPTSVPASQAPAQSAQPSLLSTLGREAGIAGSGLVHGASSLIGLPDELNSAFNAHAPTVLANANQWKPNPITNVGASLPSWMTAPIAPAVNNALTSAGIINNPSLEPQNTPERLLQAGAEGLGSTLPSIGLGGLGATARALSTGIAGGLAGEAAHEALPNSSIAPIAAGTLAGFGLGGVAALTASGRLEHVASALGDSRTMQQAGNAMQDAVRDWKSNVLPMKLDALASPLDAKMAANPDVNLTNLDKTLASMTTQAGKAQPLSDLISSRLPKQLADRLQQLGGPQVTTPGGQTFNMPSLPYEDARQFRSDLGELLANPKLIPGADVSKIKAIYGALSNDIGTTAKVNGAGDEWEAFNKGSNNLYRIAEGPMSKIASDPNPANEHINPEDAATKIFNAGKRGASDLADLRQEIPGAVDELAAAHLRSSPQLWTKLSPEAQQALVPDEIHRLIVDSSAGPKPGPFSGVTHGAAAIVGGELGEHFGNLATQTLGLTGIPPDAMALTAMGAPLIYRGARALMSNPERAGFPIISGIAGNALSLESPQSKPQGQ